MSRILFGIMLLTAAAAAPPPTRIVSTAPSITEILFALGLGDRVTGVTTYCHYPPEATRKPKIGTYMQPNLEAILAQRPDLVLVEKNPLGITAKLRSLGLRVEEVDAQSARALPAAIRAIAAYTAVSGEPLIQTIAQGLAEVQRETAGKTPVKTMFVVGRNPGSLDGLMVAAEGSYLDEIIRVAGGVNAFTGTRSAYPRISLEEVLARQPDVIIDMGDMSDTVGVTEARKAAVRALWKKYPALKAVVNGRVYSVAERSCGGARLCPDAP
jgi:iron complex transport system substrate-binding protein